MRICFRRACLLHWLYFLFFIFLHKGTRQKGSFFIPGAISQDLDRLSLHYKFQLIGDTEVFYTYCFFVVIVVVVIVFKLHSIMGVCSTDIPNINYQGLMKHFLILINKLNLKIALEELLGYIISRIITQ